MHKKPLGLNGPLVGPVGLGCLRMSDIPEARAECVATIQSAIDQGITLLNTGDFYGMGDNEMLIGEAIRGRRDKVFLSVKYGGLRHPSGKLLGGDVGYGSTMTSLSYSLRRLGTDYIDLYQPARLYPGANLEETMAALVEAKQAGYIRHIGLSEVGPETLRQANAIHPVVAVEAEYSMAARDVEANILKAADQAGIAFVAYGVMGAGLLASNADKALQGSGARFDEANRRTNLLLAEKLRKLASELGATLAQVAVAWILSRGPHILPLVGACNRKELDDSLGGVALSLDEGTFAAIDEICREEGFSGAYYPASAGEQIALERRCA